MSEVRPRATDGLRTGIFAPRKQHGLLAARVRATHDCVRQVPVGGGLAQLGEHLPKIFSQNMPCRAVPFRAQPKYDRWVGISIDVLVGANPRWVAPVPKVPYVPFRNMYGGGGGRRGGVNAMHRVEGRIPSWSYQTGVVATLSC